MEEIATPKKDGPKTRGRVITWKESFYLESDFPWNRFFDRSRAACERTARTRAGVIFLDPIFDFNYSSVRESRSKGAAPFFSVVWWEFMEVILACL